MSIELTTTTTSSPILTNQITTPSPWIDPYNNGYTCPQCHQWISHYTSHQCVLTHPYYIPPTIIITPPAPIMIQQFPPNKDLRDEIQELRDQIMELMDILQSLRELTHNTQDEKVCRDTQRECEGTDSRGVSGVCLEAPKPRGDWAWPKDEGCNRTRDN